VKLSLADDERRRDVLFAWFNLIMGAASCFMTLVNVFTKKRMLMWATLGFAVACAVNELLALRKGAQRQCARHLFLCETAVLCAFFCISGTPEGFSALWTCFIPSFTLAMLGKKGGTFYSGFCFLIVVFLFWTPWGRGLLRYDYTKSFQLRFPMIYIAFYAMAYLLESVRADTQKQLLEAEERYRHLYNHDALTGCYNRYGFNEQLEKAYAVPVPRGVSLLIVDIDHFKRVNDTYGHDMGDEVLKYVARLLERRVGSAGAVCRWGGEEFTTLLSGDADAQTLAGEICREMERSAIPIGKDEVCITVSIGVCMAQSKAAVSAEQLMAGADRSLYAAKKAGRNRVVCCEL